MLEDPDPELRQMATDEVSAAGAGTGSHRRRIESAAASQRSPRRKEHRARNPRRHWRRRGHVVRRRNVPHVQPLRRIAEMARGSDVRERVGSGRPQGSDRAGQRQQSLQPSEVRKRCASRAARSGRPSSRAASTPRPSPWQCFRKRTKWKSRSKPRISASIRSVPPDPAANPSTPPTRPFASRTCPPA